MQASFFLLYPNRQLENSFKREETCNQLLDFSEKGQIVIVQPGHQSFSLIVSALNPVGMHYLAAAHIFVSAAAVVHGIL
jgi:hypothetical protein